MLICARSLISDGRSLAGGVPDTRIDQFAAVRSKDRQGGSNSKKRAAERSAFLLLFTTKQVADCRTSYNLLNP